MVVAPFVGPFQKNADRVKDVVWMTTLPPPLFSKLKLYCAYASLETTTKEEDLGTKVTMHSQAAVKDYSK